MRILSLYPSLARALNPLSTPFFYWCWSHVRIILNEVEREHPVLQGLTEVIVAKVRVYLRARSTNVGFGFGEVLQTRAFLCDMPSGVLCSIRSVKYRDIQTLREQVNVLFLFQSQYCEWWNASASLVLTYFEELCLKMFHSTEELMFFFNPLTLNDHYSGRTAPITSKVAFYIFIQQI